MCDVRAYLKRPPNDMISMIFKPSKTCVSVADAWTYLQKRKTVFDEYDTNVILTHFLENHGVPIRGNMIYGYALKCTNDPIEDHSYGRVEFREDRRPSDCTTFKLQPAKLNSLPFNVQKESGSFGDDSPVSPILSCVDPSSQTQFQTERAALLVKLAQEDDAFAMQEASVLQID
jgi:hypothetical protein